MEKIENMSCLHHVARVVPVRIRIIQILLYITVFFFALIGTFGGLYWGIMAVGTLVFAWYLIGIAKTSFNYELIGTDLRVERVSGFASRPKTEAFARFDLTTVHIAAPEGSPLLEAEDAASLEARPRRIVYDLTSHDKSKKVYIMFLPGSGPDEGHIVKAYIEPSPDLLTCIRRAAPGRVKE